MLANSLSRPKGKSNMSKRVIPSCLAAVVVLGLFGAASAVAQSANRIEVAIQDLRNDNGTVRCGLFASAETFPKNGKQFRGAIATISNRQATCAFDDVPPGKYAVAAFHAEQNETEMQHNWLGVPKEGYGFSRGATGSMGPPKFSDAAFDYAGGIVRQGLKLNY